MNTGDFSILYVDDDDNDIRLLKFASEPAGVSHCLQTVDSGSQAVDYLQGHGSYADRGKFPIPNLVLLDLRMPRMNGFDVLRWLRSRPEFRGIVIIVFTASAHPQDIDRACELGANAFVQKPTSHRELIEFLKLLKEFWSGFHLFPSREANPSLAELDKPELMP